MAAYRELMDDGLVTLTKAFVTMRAKADMTMFEWQRHVEELRKAISDSVKESEWGTVKVYGPESGGFDPYPGICVEVQLPTQSLAALVENLALIDVWLTLPVHVYATTPVMH